VQHHLAILVVEITVLFQDGFAAKTDGDWFLTIYMADLPNLRVRNNSNFADESITIVSPNLSWYIKHSLISGSAQSVLQSVVFLRHLGNGHLRSTVIQGLR
jgi:hypothetical protein